MPAKVPAAQLFSCPIVQEFRVTQRSSCLKARDGASICSVPSAMSHGVSPRNSHPSIIWYPQYSSHHPEEQKMQKPVFTPQPPTPEILSTRQRFHPLQETHMLPWHRILSSCLSLALGWREGPCLSPLSFQFLPPLVLLSQWPVVE